MSKRSITVPLVSLAMIFVATGAFAVNSLDVNADAALGGSNFGLEVLVDGSANGVFVADTSPNDELVYRAEFRANRNDMSMDDGASHAILFGRRGGPTINNIRVFMKFIDPEFKVTVRAKKDGAGTANCGKTTFAPGGGVRIGIEWVAATGAASGDGECRLFRNGVEVFENTTLQNFDMEVDAVRFGAPDGVGATSTGSFYLDDFSSFRTLAP